MNIRTYLTENGTGLAIGVVVAVLALGACFVAVARPRLEAAATDRASAAALRSESDATEANLLSPEAVAAWAERAERANTAWTAYLTTLPASEEVEVTFSDLKALARPAGVDLREFERKQVTPAVGAPGATAHPASTAASATPGAGATPLAPGVEVRRVRIKYRATSLSHNAFLSAMAAYPRKITVDEFKAVARTGDAYSIEVEMVVSVYFRRRGDEIAAGRAA